MFIFAFIIVDLPLLVKNEWNKTSKKVEDTLSLNRQSKLEKDFANFIDDARMDALDRIQTLCQPKENIYMEIYYPRLTCLIFEARLVIFLLYSKSI